MRIVLIVEGRTEEAFKPALVEFLRRRLNREAPVIEMDRCEGLLPKEHYLRNRVGRHLAGGADAVIALTDVRPDFEDARDAKKNMSQWVGDERRFYPHAAQHDFEAWLLPYWDEIQKITGCSRNAPPGNPELVNRASPPADRIREAFRTGMKTKNRRSYLKTRDAKRILAGKDLSIAAVKCRELADLLNTLLKIAGGDPVFK